MDISIKSFTVGRVSTQAYIVFDSDSSTAFMIDPGENAERLLDELEGYELKYIILTHAHFDHVMAVPEIVEKTRAKLVVHEREIPALSDPDLAGYTSFGIRNMPVLKEDIAVRDGDEIPFGDITLQVIHTPGHTPGSMCIRMGDLIFTGDTLFAGTCGRCDFPGGDFLEMYSSLKRLAELPGDLRVYPGHDRPTNLDTERSYNPYMREAMRR